MARRPQSPARRPDRRGPTRSGLVRARVASCLFLVAALAAVMGACAGDGSASGTAASDVPPGCGEVPEPRRLVPEVIRELPHDPTSFTQGLDEVDGVLYESAGRVGESRLIVLDAGSGSVLAERSVDPKVFAEGLTHVDGELVQLTWRDGIAFRWTTGEDPTRPPEPAGRWTYDGEGWGITTLDDGTLAMSDGSDVITERDPDDFSVLRTWKVERAAGGSDQLNELEWDGERLWANRWQTDEIVGIDTRCGQVVSVVDASALTERAREAAGGEGIDVLNGVAHIGGSDRYLVTGKLWPLMFEVRFVPA